MDKLTISGIQFDIVWEDKDANFHKLESILRDIPSGTDIVVLPEMFTTGFTMNSIKLAETMQGKSISRMKTIAKSLGKVIAGSLIIYDKGKYKNRFVWIEPDGNLCYYDKKHLFTPGGEREFYFPGNKRKIIEYKGWKIFPSICYDLRFPKWLQNDLNYDILINVASWPKIRSEHWKTFLRSRAIENQAYSIGINRTGIDGRDIAYSGDSTVYDYDGNMLSALGNTEGVITSTFLQTNLQKYRNQYPFLKDIK